MLVIKASGRYRIRNVVFVFTRFPCDGSGFLPRGVNHLQVEDGGGGGGKRKEDEEEEALANLPISCRRPPSSHLPQHFSHPAQFQLSAGEIVSYWSSSPAIVRWKEEEEEEIAN